MQLGLLEPLSGCAYHCQGLSEHGEPCLRLPYLPIGLGEQSKITRSCYLCPRSPKSRESLVELGNPLLPLSLHSQRPPAQDHAQRQELRDPLLAGERHAGLCPLLGSVYSPAIVMHPGRIVEGTRQAEGV